MQELESRHVNRGEVGEHAVTWAVLAPAPPRGEKSNGIPHRTLPRTGAAGALPILPPREGPHTPGPPSKGSLPIGDSGLQSRGGMATATLAACATLGSGSRQEIRTGGHHGTIPIRALTLSVEREPRGAEQDARVGGRKDRPGKGTSEVPCPPCRNSTSGNQAAFSVS